MILVVSPHLDDAVLSLGMFLDDQPARLLTIVTVFAGLPPRDVLTPYDEARGFRSSRASVRARLDEDAEALRVLGVGHVIHLGHLDAQYGVEPDVERIVDDLRAILDRDGDDSNRVLGPLGIAHSDHVVASEASIAAVGPTDQLVLYEDVPSRVLWPPLVGDRVHELGARGLVPVEYPLPHGRRDAKRDAVHRYRSQFDDLDDPCFYVPERAWEVTP